VLEELKALNAGGICLASRDFSEAVHAVEDVARGYS
jgi:hypothetical protein